MAFNLFTRAQSNPSLPSNMPNPNFQFQDMAPTLDGLMEAYLASKRDARAAELQGLQTQQVRGQIAAQDATQTAQFGAPLASYTPQQMNMAAGSQPLPAIYDQGMTDRLTRLREGLAKLGGRDQATLDAQAAARQKESVGLDLTRSQIAENNAQAAKLQADAAAERNGTGPGAAARRPASTEFTARGFADKAKQANDALEAVVAGGFQPSKMTNILEGIAPVAFQSSNFQQADQARRQFVNAVLRRESGAAIPPSELENYTRQYFPVPGDSPEVLKQKAQARRLAIAGLEQEGARVPSALPSKDGRRVGRFVVEEG